MLRAASETQQYDRPDEVVFPVRRRHPETNRWFNRISPSNGAAMWNIIINLIYEQSYERYLFEALSIEVQETC